MKRFFVFNRYNVSYVVLDIFTIIVSYLLALKIVYYTTFSIETIKIFLNQLIIILPVFLLSYGIAGLYRHSWKHIGLEEIAKGLVANLFAFVIVVFTTKWAELEYVFMMELIAIFFITFVVLLMRLFIRLKIYIEALFERKNNAQTALIIGAGEAGVMLLEELNRNIKFNFNVLGFIDDDFAKLDTLIKGKSVLGTTKDMVGIIQNLSIDFVFIAIPTENRKRIKEIISIIEPTGAQVKLLPPFYEIVNMSKDQVFIRDVEINDLLGRDEVLIDMNLVSSFISDKVICVTGGGGSIGSELIRQIVKFNPQKVVIIDIYENNVYDLEIELRRLIITKQISNIELEVLIASVRDKDRMNEIFEKHKPNVVFHAAAHKHVPLMETSPLEALKNNVLGTYNVASLADQHSVERFVLISTDKAVNSTNVMGATKRAAEKVIFTINQTSKTVFTAVRFGNVLGSNGSVIPLFKKQIAQGGPVTVTHKKITRFFMTIPEACQLVIQAAGIANAGDLFILDMGEPVRIIDLAEKMIRLSGFEPYTEIPIVFTGLRPGEKMYEELLLDKESSQKTDNNLIFIETNNFVKRETEEPIFDLVDQLNNHSIKENQVKDVLKKYIFSYQPK
jgi:FlaA1/EpsC-like NDP-sugar epimerase